MQGNWTIRTFKEGDEAKVFELRKAARMYPETARDAWLAWWRWSYDKNPAGSGKAWLMEDNGHLVGQYRLLWMDVKVRDRVLKVAQGADSMTHQNYRRQGINSALIRHAIDDASKAGFHIAIGFVGFGSGSFAVHMRLGYIHVGTMQYFFKPLNWNSVIKSVVTCPELLQSSWQSTVLAMGAALLFDKMHATARSPLGTEGLIVRQAVSFDERINGLWARVSDRNKVMVVRSLRYLNWRYAAPGRSYRTFVAEKANEVVGYVVLSSRMARGIMVTYIFDLLAQSDEVMQTLVSKVVEDSRLNNADVILYPLMADQSYREILGRSGFVSLPFVKAAALVAYCTSNAPVSRAFLGDPRNWLIQLGDSDTT